MNNKDPASSEKKFLFKMILDQYGMRLTAAELKEVRKEVSIIVETAKILRSIKLENSVEPFSLFKPYRKEK